MYSVETIHVRALDVSWIGVRSTSSYISPCLTIVGQYKARTLRGPQRASCKLPNTCTLVLQADQTKLPLLWVTDSLQARFSRCYILYVDNLTFVPLKGNALLRTRVHVHIRIPCLIQSYGFIRDIYTNEDPVHDYMALVTRKLERLYGIPYRAPNIAIEPRTSVSQEPFFREKYSTRKLKIEKKKWELTKDNPLWPCGHGAGSGPDTMWKCYWVLIE